MKNKKILILSSIVVFTNLFIIKTIPLTSTNLSGILQHQPFLVWFWALGSSLPLLILLIQCAIILKQNRNQTILISLFIEFLLILSLLTQYAPTSSALYSGLHLLFAYLYFFGLNTFFIKLLIAVQWNEYNLFQCIMKIYLILCFTCSFLFMIQLSITTLFEIVFTMGFLLCTVQLHKGLSN